MIEHPPQRYTRDNPLVVPRMDIFLGTKRHAGDPLEYVNWIARIDGEDRATWPASGYESDQQLAAHALRELMVPAPSPRAGAESAQGDVTKRRINA